MSASKDLTGLCFGQLTVVSKSLLRKRQCVLWECLCTCGETCYVASSTLTGNYKKSCGCLRRKLMTENPIRYKHGQAKSPLYFLWSSAKHRASVRGLEFSLVFEDLVVPSICPVLDIPLAHSANRHTSNSPSLDRIDNSKGYTKENTRVISRRANVLKNDATIEELEKILKYMKGDL